VRRLAESTVMPVSFRCTDQPAFHRHRWNAGWSIL